MDTPLLRRTAEIAAEYLRSLPERPVRAGGSLEGLRSALRVGLKDSSTPALQVIEELAAAADPGLVGTQSPRYFGFVIGGALDAAIAADWLTSVWDQIGAGYLGGPSAAVVEEVVCEWLLDILGLPDVAGVGLTTGCQMAHFTCLAAARHRLLADAGWDVEADGLFGAPPIRVLVGARAHTTVFAALRMLGLGNRSNLASGYQALEANTTGSYNLASGVNALSHSRTASYNLAEGQSALFSDSTGTENVATGTNGLYADTTGSFNVAGGVNALRQNTTGSSNTALGTGAGFNLTTGANNVDIASRGVAADAARIRIGTPGVQTAVFLAGVNGVAIPGPAKSVVVNANGQLGTAPAGSARSAQTRPGSSTDPELKRRLDSQAAQLRRQATQLRRQAEPAAIQQRLLHPGEPAPQDAHHQIVVEVGLRAGRPAPVELLQQRDDPVRHGGEHVAVVLRFGRGRLQARGLGQAYRSP